MKADELAQELGHPEAQKLLSGSMARLAYTGPDGFPRVIPTGFCWTGDRIVVSTATTSPKGNAWRSLSISRRCETISILVGLTLLREDNDLKAPLTDRQPCRVQRE